MRTKERREEEDTEAEGGGGGSSEREKEGEEEAIVMRDFFYPQNLAKEKAAEEAAEEAANTARTISVLHVEGVAQQFRRVLKKTTSAPPAATFRGNILKLCVSSHCLEKWQPEARGLYLRSVAKLLRRLQRKLQRKLPKLHVRSPSCMWKGSMGVAQKFRCTVHWIRSQNIALAPRAANFRGLRRKVAR